MTFWIDTVQMHRSVCKNCGESRVFYDVDEAHGWMAAHVCGGQG